MASSKESIMVEKLNNSNYTYWQFKLEVLLINEQLIDVVTDPISVDL